MKQVWQFTSFYAPGWIKLLKTLAKPLHHLLKLILQIILALHLLS